tara:strand:+ start:774 stop:1001 length:228 start_codon:yes stop_codon:yes gene_type:complete
MEKMFDILENYGLSVALLIACLYCLYQFFWFSIREVKHTFTKKHDDNAEKMEQLTKSIEKINTKINTIMQFIVKK